MRRWCAGLPGAPSKFDNVSSVAATTEPGGPVVDEHAVVFVLADRYRHLAGVRLEQDLGLGGVAFTRERTQWWLRIPRPPVDRMEYLFEIEDANGRRSTITDPGNPLRAPGAFGDKSVLEFGDYRAPDWLHAAGVPGVESALAVDAPLLGSELTGVLWAPADLDDDEPAPLLVVHDGPEFAVLGGFTEYLAAMIADGVLPLVRAALLAPGERNDWYSANPAYAQTLMSQLLPTLPPATARIGVGVSLGALAMLHAHRTQPPGLDGLFLQSGSFFTPDLDGQESGFSGFAAVTEFVDSVQRDDADTHPVPTVITCGIAEENLANNQRIALRLTELGYRTSVHTVRDAHNYVAWRDALHPCLTGLINDVAGDRAA
jgi:enterochelin esterase family protein